MDKNNINWQSLPLKHNFYKEVEVIMAPALRDNFAYIIKDVNSNACAVVDPPDLKSSKRIIQELELEPVAILLTHHHMDHVGGVRELIDHYSATLKQVFGNEDDLPRLPCVNQPLKDGASFSLFEGRVVIETFRCYGHTLGHISYYLPQSHVLFCGDTVFAMGCGRLFEGSPEQMLSSMKKIAALPDDTAIFCAHEYTLANARFAHSVDPLNREVKKRLEAVKDIRDTNAFTIPTTLDMEKKTNPFLRCHEESLRKNIDTAGLANMSDASVFAAVRKLKDSF